MEVGDLQQPRDSHGVIYVGSSFLVIGGDSDDGDRSENCVFEDGLAGGIVQLRCVNQDPNLYKYYNYPELFLVNNDFGKDISKCWMPSTYYDETFSLNKLWKWSLPYLFYEGSYNNLEDRSIWIETFIVVSYNHLDIRH